MLRTEKWSLCAALLVGAGVGLSFLAAASAGAGQGRGDDGQPREKTEAPAEPVLFNPDRADDEKAIRQIDAEFVRAFNAGDLDAAVASFAKDGQVVDDQGKTYAGLDAIRNRFTQSFQNSPGATLEVKAKSLKFLGPDTAIERGMVTFHYPDEDTPDETNPYSVVYVKRDGKWLQASVEDHATPPEPEPESNTERLKALEGLIGEWINEGPDAVVLTNCRWDEGKNFLLQDYTVRAVGKPVLRGTQRIGWDPLHKQIRSWSFDSDGGFGEGHWSRDADGRWVVRFSGTTREGRTAESTRFISLLDDHRIQWESVDRSLDGEAQPDIDAFVMVRKPPSPTPVADTRSQQPGAAQTPRPR